ncbi:MULTISPECIES: DsbA family protein [unclassified Lactobacillus]|uniref:DsbA family protein n=1 Tax=unclassified Lactobacillus TaxID=2620435 RepID=UPI0023F6D0FC|nr:MULTISPECIES: DsbA family protein [unclassified Lactobacillus]MDF7669384.1 DsbA family protein [Lactobacillus sp. ESL0703]WEV39107.1 DsbA family protein [Lactobacillus sp. ESL0680]
MFEIFLFVNPIGIYCYDTELLIKQATNELNIDTCFNYIPITNTKVISADIVRRRKDGQKLTDISKYSMASFQTLRIYHAIKLEYGNKKARAYIVELQQALNVNFNLYSENLQQKIAKKLNLDFKKINNPKADKYIDKSIKQDMDLADKMNVRNTPTTIIYNESGNYNGILLEGTVAHDKLINVLKHDSCFIENFEEETKNCNLRKTNHLRLI